MGLYTANSDQEDRCSVFGYQAVQERVARQTREDRFSQLTVLKEAESSLCCSILPKITYPYLCTQSMRIYRQCRTYAEKTCRQYKTVCSITFFV